MPSCQVHKQGTTKQNAPTESSKNRPELTRGQRTPKRKTNPTAMRTKSNRNQANQTPTRNHQPVHCSNHTMLQEHNKKPPVLNQIEPGHAQGTSNRNPNTIQLEPPQTGPHSRSTKSKTNNVHQYWKPKQNGPFYKDTRSKNHQF